MPINTFFTSAISLDFETTSPNPKEAEICQIGIAIVNNNEWKSIQTLVKPSIPIPPEASALTHISNKLVENAPNFDEVKTEWTKYISDAQYIISHNYLYEKEICERLFDLKDLKWICTLRLARHIFKDDETIANFQLSYLRYRLNLNISDNLHSHRADSDAISAGLLLGELINLLVEQGKLDENGDVGQQLLELQAMPILVDKMPFGKHKGELLENVPVDYWQWALNNMDSLQESNENFDPDFAASVELALTKKLDIT